MFIGIDFDNTIVCYDALFHRLALERGLIESPVPINKTAVRDALRAAGREADWTELQGIAYGPRIVDAIPFPGAKDFLQACRSSGIKTAVISHKTKHPYLGEPHDLHAAAYAFLRHHGFLDALLSNSDVYLELTKEAKLARIASLGCDVFIDDLPELLLEATFPAKPKRILFDPAGMSAIDARYTRAESWNAVAKLILGKDVAR